MKCARPNKMSERLGAALVFLGLVIATSLAAQNGSSWFRAKDLGPRPNPASRVPSPVEGLNPIPLQLSGLGLIEAIQDKDIRANTLPSPHPAPGASQ